MSQLGEMDEVIDAVLNHKKQGIIKVYNQNRYDREKQAALESWERKLQQIVTGKGKDNVVSITTEDKGSGIKPAQNDRIDAGHGRKGRETMNERVMLKALDAAFRE